MKKLLFLFVLTLLSCGKIDQLAPYNMEDELGSSYDDVDARVKDVPAYLEYNVRYHPTEEALQELVDYLVEDASTTREKAKILHDWISVHIFYDHTHYDADGEYPPTFPMEVLRRRQTVCAGYAILFQVMAKMANLRVACVTGSTANNHMWNAVYDNGAWYHIDTTWDSGSFQDGTVTYWYRDVYFYQTAATFAAQTGHVPDVGGYDYIEDYEERL